MTGMGRFAGTVVAAEEEEEPPPALVAAVEAVDVEATVEVEVLGLPSLPAVEVEVRRGAESISSSSSSSSVWLSSGLALGM